jgi:phage shock protein A
MAPADPREALRQAIASEHRLYVEAERHDQLANRWRARAELAVRRGEQALARQALERSAAEERLAATYRAQAAAHSEIIRGAKRQVPQTKPASDASADQRLAQLALEDRLERDLAALKAQLGR